MGIIQRQGIKFGLISYIGIIIGAISNFFIYSQALEVYGLAQYLISAGAFIAPFILFGIQILPVKFLPHIRNRQNGNEGFMTLLFLILLVLILLIGSGFYIFYVSITEILFSKKEPLFNQYIPYIMPFGIVISISTLLTYFCNSFERIVVPNLLSNLFLKITLPILILLSIGQYLDYTLFVNLLLIAHVVIAIGLFIYLYVLGELRFTKINWEKINPLRKEMTSYALFGLMGGLGAIFAFRIDVLMISNYIDLKAVGVYSMAIFIANAIAIPTTSIVRIAGTVISKSWKENDLNEIKNIYRTASLNLFLFGVLFYVLVMASLEDLIILMPTTEDLSMLFPIAGLIGLAKLFDMLTSTNNEIIMYSPRYKFNMYAIITLGVLNVTMNYFFIVVFDWGIIGAALATTLSLALFNLMKLIFIKWRFGIHPFSIGLIYIILLGVLSFSIAYLLIPSTSFPMLDIIIKSIFIGLCYLTISYRFRLSPQINQLVEGVWMKFRK